MKKPFFLWELELFGNAVYQKHYYLPAIDYYDLCLAMYPHNVVSTPI